MGGLADVTGDGTLPWEPPTDRLGLEIGPLDRPRVPKASHDVLYVDHLDRDGLRAKYRDDPGVHADRIAEVDLVWSGETPLADTVGSRRIGYVVASHVLEHIADPVGWLRNVETALEPGGSVYLVLPDKRYCFDHRRPLTQIWDLVDAYLRRVTAPTPRQIYEFAVLMAPADTEGIWRGRPRAKAERRTDIEDLDGFALDLCQRAISGEYIDVHCWTFTPESFVTLFTTLRERGLLSLRLEQIQPTAWGSLEFHVHLTKAAAGESAEPERAEALSAALANEPSPDAAAVRARKGARRALGRALRALHLR